MLDEKRDGNGESEAAAHVGRAVGWREIDRQMRRLARRRAALDAEEVRLMLAARRAEVHVHLGYGSFIEYLERVCCYAPRTARERLRVAEALEQLPVMREALAAGEVSFSTVRELTRVAQPHNEEDWLVATQGCTAREVEDAVRGHKPGDDPDDRPDPALETRILRIEVDSRAYALFLQARRALEAEHGQEMTDSDYIADVSLGALERVGTKGSNKPAHAIAITQCRDCKRAWQETGSKSIELPPADVERARCDAVLLGDVDGEAPGPTEGSIPRPVRRAVLARDHFRCVVPGCRSSHHIDVHHLDPRAIGGAHEMMNLITLCDCHHTAAHKGRIRIDGKRGALVVTHADGRPYGTPPPTFDELVCASAPIAPTLAEPVRVPAPAASSHGAAAEPLSHAADRRRARGNAMAGALAENRRLRSNNEHIPGRPHAAHAQRP